MEKESNDLTLKILEVCGVKGLIYLSIIINEIYLFRYGHWKFVKKYIMSNTKYNVATGGTPLTTWLPNQIKACLDKINELLLLIDHHDIGNCTKEELEILNLIEMNQKIKENTLKKELQELQEFI